MSNSNNVPVERHTWTKAERQYIKGIVHNYSLQRWTDQDIVNYLRVEKKIKIGRSTVTKIKNQVIEEAGNWYIDLKESGTKYVAVYKERLDSLLSYQKKLHEIMAGSESPEIRIRAIAELHRIEMSIFSLFKELPQFEINNNIRPTKQEEEQEPNKQHCYCHYCLPGIGDEAEVVGEGPIIEEPSTSNKPETPIITSHSSSIQEPEPEEEEQEETESESERYWRMNPVSKKNSNEVHYPRKEEEDDD